MSSGRPPPDPPPHLAARHRLLWRWRRNPLRRPTDRLQGWVALGLLLTIPVLAAFAMFGVGDTAYRHYRATAERQARALHHTAAALVHDAPGHPEPGSEEARKTRYRVTVRYTDRAGRARTGETEVLPGLSAGTPVYVWAGPDGTLAEPPMATEEIRSRAMGWALLAFLAVALTGAAAYGAVALALQRRNLADWDARWAETARH
ncbi:hypothetical protein C3486_32410 [Streptomyces sp. Ru73]|nr:hypothetical protein C3486_32410 [Streptomyces sp. Ru73]